MALVPIVTLADVQPNLKTASPGAGNSVVASVETIQQFFPQACRFSGTFTEDERLKDQNVPTGSSGIVLFDCQLGIIWKTEQPFVETQILTIKNIHYNVDDQKGLVRLKGISQSLRAKLLLSVMQGDIDYIVKHFDVDVRDASNLLLIPKSSNYKRGLRIIAVSKVEGTVNGMAINIVDKRGHESKMVSLANTIYDSAQQFEAACKTFFDEDFYCDTLKEPTN